MPDHHVKVYVGRTRGWTVVKVCLFLQGAFVLGLILALVYWGFVSRHPTVAVLLASAYIVLVAVGAYSKVAPSKPPATS
jgi:hypothetical protein